MSLVAYNKNLMGNHTPGSSPALLTLVFILPFLSGCGTAFITSKQDDLLAQIDVWSTANEYGKAFSALDNVSDSHPQYQQLQVRKKALLTQAIGYEQHIDKQIQQLIDTNQWDQALDLIDQAKEKYPPGKDINRELNKTEKSLLYQKRILLQSLEQKIMLERSQWLINTRPFYQDKLIIDPRNKTLKIQLEELNKESKILSRRLTVLAQQAINKKHYITARTRINQAIALDPDKSRQKMFSQLQKRVKKPSVKKNKRANKVQKRVQQPVINQILEIQQNAFLENLNKIEKSYNAGDFAKARRLIANLDESEQYDIQIIRLKLKLNRSISYTIKKLVPKANKYYTDGQFHQAIEIWLQILSYDPENSLAKKNIQRAEKVINKLSNLREKQQN